MSATNKVGSDSAETLNADSNDIFLWGQDGADTINGNGLDNTIGGGNDTSADTVNGGNGDDVLLIQRGNDTLNGGGDYDIARLADYEVIDTGFFVGPLFVVTDRNGFEIPSTLVGGPLNKSVISLDIGSNTMRVGAFNILDTSVGFGNSSGSNSAQDINLSGIDTSRGVMTVTNVEEFQLRNADDVFFGDTGSHVIDGRGGNDFIDGHGGADTIIGGSGIDTASYQRSDAAVSIVLNLTLNPTGLQSFGHAEGDRLFEIENIVGSAFGDSIIGSADANRLEGQNGNDTINGGAGDDFIFGGNGEDTLVGLSGFDHLFGGSENDTLTGGTAADEIDGGAGIDTVSYSSASGAVQIFLANTGGFQQTAIEHVGTNTSTARATVNGIDSIDQLDSIENAIGTSFDDRISGSEEANRLDGRSGRDTISGAGGGDTLVGGNQDDILNGDSGDDILDGGADNDDLFGGIGNDSLRGGTGLDELDGGSNSDTAEYSEKTASVSTQLNGSTAVSVLVGGLVEDTLRNVENINGGSAGDTLLGDNFNNTFNGNGGADLLRGGGGQDVLDGGSNTDTADYTDKTNGIAVALNGASNATVFVGAAGEDTIRNIENLLGGSGADILFGDGLANRIEGNNGADKMSGEGGEDTLLGGEDGDTIEGGAQNDRLEGGNGEDILSGGADNDTLLGDADNDRLSGGLGFDDLDGGTGQDTASYIEKIQSVVVDLLDGADSTVFVGGFAEDTIRNIEGFIGGQAGDAFAGNLLDNDFDGQGGDDSFRSDAGADHYNGNAGTDLVSYFLSVDGVSANLLTGLGARGEAEGDSFEQIENLSGSDGSRDILIGDNGRNAIDGFGGNDSIRGEGDDDLLDGGEGADAINGGGGSDTASYFRSNAGVNVNLLTNVNSGGEAQGDTLFFIENLDGSNLFRDILIGNDVGNIIRGRGGNDSIRGEGGNDTLIGGDGADGINGGGGIDTVSYEGAGAGVNVDLRVSLQVNGTGDSFNDTLFFIENITGTAQSDTLVGNDAVNTINGGSQSDDIEGRGGSDVLFGGSGADEFRYTQAIWGADRIEDFEDGVDQLVFDASIADDFADFTITGNGTASVVVRVNGLSGSSITLTGAPSITIDAGDILFTV